MDCCLCISTFACIRENDPGKKIGEIHHLFDRKRRFVQNPVEGITGENERIWIFPASVQKMVIEQINDRSTPFQ